jgi:hypothetical protein
MTAATTSQWGTGPEVWKYFCEQHPELGLKPGRMQFHNFLRRNRGELIERDAMRRANGRHWICNRERFMTVAFDLVTLGSKREQSIN